MKRFAFAAAVVLLAVSAVSADDLTGATELLCSPAQATVCNPEEGCETAPPWTWNIPSFIKVNLEDKTMSTTEASGEDRATPIGNVQRSGGRIFLQGVERGRAFSFVVDEATGMITAAVARDGFTVSVFGACTPAAK
jgi:hypothetical protein